jgi:hypothetical protein
MIINELCSPKLIVDLLLDMYGNYGNFYLTLVLQKALACAKEPCFSIFINSIKPNMEKLRTLNFGSKLYTKLMSLYPDLGGSSNIPDKKKKTIIKKKNGPSRIDSMSTGYSYNTGKVQNSHGMQYNSEQY